MAKRIALVTGAAKGIGLEVCRQLAARGMAVILTARDETRGARAASNLQASGLEVVFQPLEITDAGSVSAAHDFVMREYGRLDVLVNNAAILVDEGESVLEVPLETFQRVLEANVWGALRLCQVFVPEMRAQGYGRVVNVSSGWGSLQRMADEAPSYQLSKAALNAVTRLVSSAAGPRVLVNSVCPGWVRTDMGGPSAGRSVADGARGVVWAATLPDRDATGGFFRDGKPVPW